MFGRMQRGDVSMAGLVLELGVLVQFAYHLCIVTVGRVVISYELVQNQTVNQGVGDGLPG